MNGIYGAPEASDRWELYLQWNGALADVVYGPHAAGAPVYLDPEDEVLCAAANVIGLEVDEPRAAFLEALRPTLNAPNHQTGMFGSHLARLKRWRPASGEPPPIIGLLAALCLAAEDMRESDGFAANNYYDRLMPLLGVTSDADKKRVVTSYRKISFDLWESLNGWLENLHGERGLPTAYAYAHAHIGRPLSQALIRAADRAKLEEFFSDLGLEPRSRLSPEDIEPLLTGWINRTPSPASHQIQALWKRSGARERIADIASQLLETWEPPAGVERPRSGIRGGGQRSALRLLALMRTFPSPALELNLVGPDVEGERLARLVDPTDGADVGIDLALDAIPGGRWRLAEADEFESRSLVEGAIRLRFPSGSTLDRRPQRVVPLKKDDLLQAFLEVERLALGEDGMIICTAPLAAIVEDALGKVARPGFRRVEPSPPGCPAEWTLFTHIEVLAPLFATSPNGGGEWPLDLNVLQPLATSQLVVQGGLQLPGRVRRWSSRAAPEIRAAGEDIAGLRVTIDRVGAFKEATRVLERESDEPFVLVDLQDSDLGDGDYEIEALATSRGSKPRILNTARLRLRSGSVANPNPRGERALARPADAASLGTLFASAWDGESAAVRGATLTPRPGPGLALQPADVGVPDWWHRRRDSSAQVQLDGGARPRLSISTAAPTGCFQTGAHVLQLPTYYGKVTAATVEGFCKHCGLVKRFPGSYYRLQRRRPQPKQRTTSPPTFHLADLPPVLLDQRVTPDIALDALSHDLTGPASWLEQVALQVEPSQLFVDRFIRDMDLLAHIEVRRDVQSLAPVTWEVVPPTLVELPAGGIVLCGRRSERIEDAVLAAAGSAGVPVERSPQGVSAPGRILIATLSASDVLSIAEVASATAGLDIGVASDAARQLAYKLPFLTSVIQSLPRQAMVGASSIKRWSSDVARWRPVGDASIPGAYQLLSPRPVYCLRDDDDIEEGTMRRVDARLAKHAAALADREPMVGYDENTQTLYVPLGAELPGLYGRAAVLCSGLVPTEDGRQRVTRYRAVPREVAEHLSALLGDEAL